MKRLHTQIKNITTKPESSRPFSMTVGSSKKKNSCEETDCCGNSINVQPKPKMFVERSCHPCSFFTWKPKIPILESAPPLTDVRRKPFKKKHCYAGMKLIEKSLEEIKKEAAECQKKCAVIPDCSPSPPPPPVKEKPDCNQITIPAPDWDVNREEPKPKQPEWPC